MKKKYIFTMYSLLLVLHVSISGFDSKKNINRVKNNIILQKEQSRVPLNKAKLPIQLTQKIDVFHNKSNVATYLGSINEQKEALLTDNIICQKFLTHVLPAIINYSISFLAFVRKKTYAKPNMQNIENKLILYDNQNSPRALFFNYIEPYAACIDTSNNVYILAREDEELKVFEQIPLTHSEQEPSIYPLIYTKQTVYKAAPAKKVLISSIPDSVLDGDLNYMEALKNNKIIFYYSDRNPVTYNLPTTK